MVVKLAVVAAVLGLAGFRYGGLLAQPLAVGPCQSPYTVQPGDWIYKIASACGVNALDLIAANNLANPNQIQAGQQLVLPLPGGDAAQPAADAAESSASDTTSTANTAAESVPVAVVQAPAQSVASAASLVVRPSADGFVDAEDPAAAFGSWPILRTKGTVQTSYLTFDVAVPDGAAITGASLRVFAHGSSPNGFAVHAAGHADWTEGGLTQGTAPGIGAGLGASGAHGGGRYVEVNLGGYIAASGRYSLVLVPLGDKSVAYSSREAGAGAPELVLITGGSVPPPEVPPPTVAPPEATVVPPPAPTEAPVEPTAAQPPALGNPLQCDVSNIAWSADGQLLRGGRPNAAALACLAAAGVDVLVDQRAPGEVDYDEAGAAAALGMEYINLGIPDDTAPSPATVRAWIDTVNSRLSQGQVVLVHDRAGRGRMGFWDAVFAMQRGASAQQAIEDRYLGKAYPFAGAKIGCGDGGRGQVQALAEIGAILTGQTYYPSVDEYGTTWSNCARPDYMAGWDYGSVLP